MDERLRSRRQLEESEAQLQFALEVSQLGAWELDVATGEADRSLLHDRIFGYDELCGEWSVEIALAHMHEADRDLAREKIEGGVARQEPYDFECRIRRPDGEVRWIEAHGRPVFDDKGELTKYMGTLQDITARKEAQEQQKLLLDELQHRVKNSLATTLAIVQFSSRQATDVTSFIRTLRDRLQAISRTHDLLTANDWRGGHIREIVQAEAAPYLDNLEGRFKVTGDDPLLSSKQMLSLTLAFHELVTNAAKHGALLNPAGSVTVTITVRGDSEVELLWQESGGPPVSEPDRNQWGFGSLLLQEIIGPELRGKAELEFAKAGLAWKVVFPLHQQTES